MGSSQHTVILLLLFLQFTNINLGVVNRQKKVLYPAQDIEASDVKEGLKIFAKISGDTFHLDDIVELELTLKNVGKSPLAIFKRYMWEGHPYSHVDIQNEQNHSMPLKTIPSGYRPPQNLSADDFIVISPDKTISRKYKIILNVYEIEGPGDYKILVWYRNPISEVLAPGGVPLWGSENGTIYAKAMHIKITN